MSISLFSRSTQQVLKHPAAFALQTLKGFSDNQGLLLAAAIAYYALLSVVPLLILSVIALSHLVEQAELLATLGHYLEHRSSPNTSDWPRRERFDRRMRSRSVGWRTRACAGFARGPGASRMYPAVRTFAEACPTPAPIVPLPAGRDAASWGADAAVL
jgi:hypothetical protein